ncbi:hypothetical protein GYMLUDRAFT_64261 [Collybiopsis luxurians FD-317 M1]|uniref:F-box domain-containing protein n=1 Tax=Collybiopsis luxurians FD-317 M1 TaxID=944289 RepID=A0A0D0AQ57_9AGAR|nr:hypothetical protein GYMLUDRAFT_64261 [Collybiopsis luxurians FD-317 M1]
MASTSVIEVVDDAGMTYQPEVYTVGKKTWLNFRATLKIPRAISFNYLIHAAEVLDLLSHREPKIQAVTSLPDELIDYIMSLALPSRTRLLSATCEHFRQIDLFYFFRVRLYFACSSR